MQNAFIACRARKVWEKGPGESGEMCAECVVYFTARGCYFRFPLFLSTNKNRLKNRMTATAAATVATITALNNNNHV